MLEIFGYNFDIISFIPAMFAVVLSMYNYYKMSRPANIVPTEMVNYGLISSGYEGAYKIVLPLVFHNEGVKKGIIKKVKIGFRIENKINYLNTPLKAHLNELTEDLADLSDWNKFMEYGYRIINPTYPITVLAESSVDVTFITTVSIDDEIIPLDMKCEYVLEIHFGKNKINREFFPFYLAKESIPDDRLIWFYPFNN